MTLQEVPTEILKESLLALADLRRKYTDEDQITKYRSCDFGGDTLQWDCPLCNLADLFGSKDVGEKRPRTCGCPWFWIEGHRCCDSGSHPDFHRQPISFRLARIDRWEAAINAEITGRAA